MGKAKVEETREIKYPKLESVWYISDKGLVKGPSRGPITSDVAKEMLGWEEEEVEGGPKFGNDYLFKDRYGKKIRCRNDVRNRPIYWTSIEAYIQDILRLRWETNGESIIIGKTAIVLNGQHQLISVVLAEQDRQKQHLYWEENWPGEVYIQKLVVFGVEESDAVVNTMDTCKPRSLADVIYRSPYFSKMPEEKRRIAARMTDHAVRQLWYRTGIYVAGSESFSVRRTHAEAIDFINNHPDILKCVKHILEENKDGHISLFVGAGYASAMMYLMAVSKSNSDDYYGPEERSEKPLNWDNWDKACQFWSEFGQNDNLKALREKITELSTDDGTGGRLSEKDYLICQAWKAYVENGKVEKRDLKIKYTDFDSSGRRHLIEQPDLGGIDLGISKHVTPPVEVPSTEEQVEQVENGKEEVEKVRKAPKSNEGVDWGWLEELHAANSKVNPIFTRSALGNWVAWGDDGEIVSKVMNRENKMNPKGRKCVSIKPSDIDEAIALLNKAGYQVGLAAEEDGQWVMQTIYSSMVANGEVTKAKKGAKK